MLQAYAEKRELAKGALRKIADAIGDRQGLHDLQALFAKFDKDGNGSLDVDEFDEVLQEFGAKLTSNNLKQIFKVVDADGSGTIDIDEFAEIAKCEMELSALDDVVGDNTGIEAVDAEKRKAMKALQEKGVRLGRSASVMNNAKLQGDIDMLRPEAMMKRADLKENVELWNMVQAWWNQCQLKVDGKMGKDAYMVCSLALHKNFLPDVSEEEAQAAAEADWLTDCPPDKGQLAQLDFFNAMFELCDNWCDSTEVADYTHMIRRFESAHLTHENAVIAKREEEERVRVEEAERNKERLLDEAFEKAVAVSSRAFRAAREFSAVAEAFVTKAIDELEKRRRREELEAEMRAKAEAAMNAAVAIAQVAAEQALKSMQIAKAVIAGVAKASRNAAAAAIPAAGRLHDLLF
jgi:Ca2+-binding EF-hand superfamily protein